MAKEKLTKVEIEELVDSLTERELSDIKFAQQQVRNFAEIQRNFSGISPEFRRIC